MADEWRALVMLVALLATAFAIRHALDVWRDVETARARGPCGVCSDVGDAGR